MLCNGTQTGLLYFVHTNARTREQMHTFTYARMHAHACTHTSVVHTYTCAHARARNPFVLVVCLLHDPIVKYCNMHLLYAMVC
jgi:hypothetical protein